MADEKKYYWIKLRESFITSDAVDFLMSQKNGSQYVVLYQMLCLKTANTGGELARTIGEIIIPYDAEKIQRDCKYFDIDTVRVALELYIKLGLVYEQGNGFLKIAEFEKIVGGETSKAEIMRRKREKEKEQVGNIVTELLPNCYPIVTQEIDIRDRYKDIKKDIKEKEKEKEKIPFSVGLKDEMFACLYENKKKSLSNSAVNEVVEQVLAANFSEDVLSAVTEWLAYKKCDYRPLGLKSLLTVIKKNTALYGAAVVIEAIQGSMADGYTGICWDKYTRNKPTIQVDDKAYEVTITENEFFRRKE